MRIQDHLSDLIQKLPFEPFIISLRNGEPHNIFDPNSLTLL